MSKFSIIFASIGFAFVVIPYACYADNKPSCETAIDCLQKSLEKLEQAQALVKAQRAQNQRILEQQQAKNEQLLQAAREKLEQAQELVKAQQAENDRLFKQAVKQLEQAQALLKAQQLENKRFQRQVEEIVIPIFFRDRLKDSTLGPAMVWIPAGRFQMGDSQGQGDPDENPVHQVSIARFAIGRYEVTFAEYDRFAEATGRHKPKDNGWGRGNHPVINVSWEEAVAYSQWLSQQTDQQYRLPTEAEWEYMARAGTKTNYWWGNQIGRNQANCMDCGSQWDDKQTAPVGSFAANGFGIYDTIGNVWEWTCSQYKQYGNRTAEQRCSSDKSADSSHVIRGGSWSANTWVVRVSSRNSILRYGTDSGVGFRVVRQQ